MFPILLSVGPVHIHSLSLFIVLSWIVFSFVFWRNMKEYAVDEEKTFDLMFYGTLAAFVGSRASYVALYWDKFTDSVLKVFALWVEPGLSLYGALVVGMLMILVLAKRRKIRIGSVLDAAAPALAAALLVGKIGSFLGASEVGVVTTLAVGLRFVGYEGLRHPVQVYEMVVLLLLFIGVGLLESKAVRAKWPYGMVGITFFFVYSGAIFGLEFLKESSLYWRGLSINQWVLLALFCESAGALYVRGGGKRIFSSIGRSIKSSIGGAYGRLFKKRSV